MLTRKIIIGLAVFAIVFSIPNRFLAAKRALPKENSTASKIILEYEFAAPSASKIGEYDLLRIEGLELYERVGAPIVPVRPVEVLVPFGKKVTACKVIALDIRHLPNTYRLAPGQQSYPLSYKGVIKPTEPNQDIYGKAKQWPGIRHEQVTTQFKRGYQVFIVNLFPLQYTPKTGKVSYAGKLRLEITLVDTSEKSILRPTKKLEAALSAKVDNPSALSTYEKGAVQQDRDGTVLMGRGEGGGDPNSPLNDPNCSYYGKDWEYIVITSPELADLNNVDPNYNFQALCDSKEEKGIPAGIVDTNWIFTNYDGTRPDSNSDNQTRIRNFLIDAYQIWGTEYVLLGGTNAIVPARMFFVIVDDEEGQWQTTMPVDMYYGCVEPSECSFDYDANGVYGEPDDGVKGSDVDLFAEIYVGRAAVENSAELANFIKKNLTYNTTTSGYLPRVAMLGEYLWLDSNGVPQYGSDCMEQIRLGGDYDGYYTGGFEEINAFITEGCLAPPNDPCCWPLYDDTDYRWPTENLINLMNGGIHIFNHLGHASCSMDMRIFTTEEARGGKDPNMYGLLSDVNNTDYFFVYSQGCDAGWFDEPNCFAEVVTTMEHGAFAVIMNARYGWGDNDSTDGASQRFNRQFWDAVIGEGMFEIGRMNQDSKEDNTWDINGGCIRWCYYELNLFGDPELQFQAFVTPQGRVMLDRDYYNCSDEVKITLADSDLSGLGSQSVSVETSPGGDTEDVNLIEEDFPSGVFTGMIYTDGNTVEPNDGILQMSDGDTIIVTYYDANDGSGYPAEANDVAEIDCQPPVITNVEYDEVILLPDSLIIDIDTNEPTSIKISCGTSCGGPYSIEKVDWQFTSHHSIVLNNLPVCAQYYYFEIEATDAAQNITTDDNNGNCYSFYTYPKNTHVPGDFNSIQEAINDALDGCIIWVDPGVYYEHINFIGKAITVRSNDPEDPCVVASTIIDGSGTSYTAQFSGGEGSDSVLKGFTITNGYSGIYCYFSYPTISNCIIEENTNCGIDSSSAPHSPPGVIIKNNTIQNNTYGIMADSACTIEENQIYSNSSTGIYSVHITGDIKGNYIYDSNKGILARYNTTAPIEENHIYGNSYGIYTEEGATVTVKENEIYDNNEGIRGLSYSNATIERNYIYDNGKGIRTLQYSTATIQSNLIYCNDYGIETESSSGTIGNDTIANNTYYGIAGSESSTIYNCIVWNNDDDLVSCYATYSCISDCIDVNENNHNICSDPCFADDANDDYHLKLNSPCINTGDPNRDYSGQVDIDGDTRVIGSCVDMGADERILPIPDAHWWKLDETSGTTAYDSVGNSNGTFNGSDPCWTDGLIDGAVDLNGVNDYFSVPSLDGAYSNSSVFTVAGWFNTNTDTNQSTEIQTIVGQWSQAAGYYYYGWQVLVENNNVVARFGNDFTIGNVTGTRDVNEGWHLFVLVHDGPSVALYVDGEPDGTAGTKYMVIYDTKFRIGDGSYVICGNPALEGGPFNGRIDNVMLFKRALPSDEIWQLYMDGLSKKASNPNPANEANEIGINTDLIWTAGENAETHDVYFGADYNDVDDANTSSAEYKGNYDVNTFDPCTLDYDTTYYWRIDEKNGAGTTTGDVWSFTTCLDPNLTNWWKLDETSGATAYDSAGDSDGTFNGDDPCWTDGLIDGAVDFNGVNDYFSVSSLNTEYSNGSVFTVTGWFETEQSTGIQTIVGQWSQSWSAGQEYFGWQVLVENNKVKARFAYNGITITDRTGTSDVNDGQWHQFAMVHNGTSVAVYVDGQPENSGTANFSVYNTKFRIGDGSYVFGYPPTLKGGPFNGMIDDVMIFDKALSAGEVEQLYDEGSEE